MHEKAIVREYGYLKRKTACRKHDMQDVVEAPLLRLPSVKAARKDELASRTCLGKNKNKNKTDDYPTTEIST